MKPPGTFEFPRVVELTQAEYDAITAALVAHATMLEGIIRRGGDRLKKSEVEEMQAQADACLDLQRALIQGERAHHCL